MLKIIFLAVLASSTVVYAQPAGSVKLMQDKNYKAAELQIKKELMQFPESESLQLNLGIAQYQLKKFNEAALTFEKLSDKGSGYSSAALYYGALSRFNLRQEMKSTLLLSKISDQSSPFFELGRELEAAIQKKSDPGLAEAQLAYDNYEYEQCLEFIENSLFIDHQEGLSLKRQCQNEIADEKRDEQRSSGLNTGHSSSAGAAEPRHSFDLFADLSLGYNNNIYAEADQPTAKPITQTVIGAEYIYKSKFDVGLGVNYDDNNVVGVDQSRDTTTSVYLPVAVYFDNSDWHTEAYYNLTQVNAQSVYHQIGLTSQVTYSLSDFSTSFRADISQRNAQDAAYTYVEGRYSTLRADLAYDTETFKINFLGAFNHIQSGDLVLTGGTLPSAYKSVRVGAQLFYWLTSSTRFLLAAQTESRKYSNQYATFLRQDQTRFLQLRLDFKATQFLKFYLENESTLNTSNYDNTQLVNKNFSENIFRVGTVLSY